MALFVYYGSITIRFTRAKRWPTSTTTIELYQTISNLHHEIEDVRSQASVPTFQLMDHHQLQYPFNCETTAVLEMFLQQKTRVHKFGLCTNSIYLPWVQSLNFLLNFKYKNENATKNFNSPVSMKSMFTSSTICFSTKFAYLEILPWRMFLHEIP